MLKIAVASVGGSVAQHFGHCESFEVFETQGGKVIKSISLENPGHKPGFLPRFLHDEGVQVIISGGMGAAAVEIFNDNNIEVIVGAKGAAEALVESYLKGELKSTGSVCHH